MDTSSNTPCRHRGRRPALAILRRSGHQQLEVIGGACCAVLGRRTVCRPSRPTRRWGPAPTRNKMCENPDWCNGCGADRSWCECQKEEEVETTPIKPYRYEEARELLRGILKNFRVLSAEQIGPSGSTWQDIADVTRTDLQILSWRIEEARKGNVVDGPLVFPSPEDLEEA